MLRGISVVAAALEPAYYPRITGHLRLRGAQDIEHFDRWRGPGNARVREQIEPLVELMTWNARGEAFEFAHFTDRQIVASILRLPRRGRSQTQQAATSSVAKIRAAAGNLESMFPTAPRVAWRASCYR